MRKLWLSFLILSFLLSLAIVGMASAFEATVTGVNITVNYQEPNVNADIPPTPLTDLDHTSIYYNMGLGDVRVKDVPATAPTGNGNITTSFEVPITVGMEKFVDIWATAWDGSFNESAKSNIVRVRVDRLAPAPPR